MQGRDDVERLLTQVSVERARGNFVAAKRLVEEALQKAPQRADIHELLGDLFQALGDPKSALECYRRAKELAPERASAEEKMAQALLALEQPTIPQEIPFLPKNPGLAATLSAVLPGAGQAYNEQWLKGFVLCALTLSSAYYLISSYFQVFEPVLRGQTSDVSVGQIFFTLGAGFLALGAWTYSIVNAYRTAKRFRELQEAREKSASQPKSLEGGQQG